eukprot:7664034-Prorocentrum_lima.AAC.1
MSGAILPLQCWILDAPGACLRCNRYGHFKKQPGNMVSGWKWKPDSTMMSFANGQKSLLKWCVVIHFPTVPEVQTMVDVHEASGIPILLSLPQIMNLGFSLDSTPETVAST